MKRKCLYCEKTFDDQNGLVCPNCQNDNDLANPDQDKVHRLHQECHRKINYNSEIFDSSMTFIVIGTLLLIVGSVFLFLSFRKIPISESISAVAADGGFSILLFSVLFIIAMSKADSFYVVITYLGTFLCLTPVKNASENDRIIVP